MIPTSVKYVEEHAFNVAEIKILNIKGSIVEWNKDWSVGYDGTVNNLG